MDEEKKEIDKEDLEKSQEKTMIKVFGVIIFFVFFVAVVYFLINSSREFSYLGVTGNVVKEGELIFYQTSIPVMYNGEVVPYYFYLRNNPEKLADIPFKGEVVTGKDVVLQDVGNFNCDGRGIISITNLAGLYEVLGSKVGKDQNATCDPEGRYILIKIEEGKTTEIVQTGPACYSVKISDCEILEATERFMVEILVKLKEKEQKS